MMCFTTEGKYFVAGKEIKIDLDNIDELPLEILKKLESCNMTQLDALYLRKRLHSLSNSWDRISNNLETQIEKIDERIKILEEDRIILSDTIRNLESLSDTIIQIKVNQEEVEKKLLTARVKEKTINEKQFNEIINRIDYVANKTIFGWIKNQWEKKPMRTALWLSLLAILSFVTLMKIFDIESFSDMINSLKNIFKWF